MTVSVFAALRRGGPVLLAASIRARATELGGELVEEGVVEGEQFSEWRFRRRSCASAFAGWAMGRRDDGVLIDDEGGPKAK